MYSEFIINCSAQLSEIVQSELINIGFEGIWENNGELYCYIETKNFNQKIFEEILEKYKLQKNYTTKIPENKNWNEEWEKSYEPVLVNSQCAIRATFHEPFNVEYEIVITPKMSFGTGHHSTTFLMAQSLFELNITNKTVLDMGCGTGILAILAEKLGASKVTAIDNEDNAVENTIENIKNNNCSKISVLKNESDFNGKFDLIMSNITKNINLEMLEKYSFSLNNDGIILLSGFYTEDVEDLKIACKKQNLKIFNQKSKNNWACIYLKK
ncbi:MAG: 50S ribosomal protein L11 methyltransferase [Bacteroidetes bacterium]|nr:50S ribosomal protein L11 methyltransferase [Bacteroidota bacterium]